MLGRLYIVATPIGNMDDITARAVNVLSAADIIAAEDTRVTLKLLTKLNIKGKLVSNHKFNELRQNEFLLGELLQGKNVAIVSDAGTPCISDPGGILVRGAISTGIEVIGVCGACAAVAALSISGFDIMAFTFGGFLPRTKKDIAEVIERLRKSESSVMVFYESPKRIINTCEVLAEIMPNSQLCLCNDLTKLYEKIYRGAPEEVCRELRDNPNAEKGEYTLVIKPPPMEKVTGESDAPSVEALIVDYMVKHSCGAKEAVKALGKDGRFSKNDFYAASLRLKEMFGKD